MCLIYAMFTLLSRVVYISQPYRLHNSVIPQTYPKIKKCLDKAALAKSEDNETKLWCEAAFYAAQTLELLDKDKERLKTKRSIGFED